MSLENTPDTHSQPGEGSPLEVPTHASDHWHTPEGAKDLATWLKVLKGDFTTRYDYLR